MTGTVKVTAGPHDVGFTWRERPAERQDVWQPALRDSQEVHMVGGMPRLRTALIEGPYNVTGVSATPSRDRSSCASRLSCRRSRVRRAHLHQPDPPRLPAARHRRRYRGAAGLLPAGPSER